MESVRSGMRRVAARRIGVSLFPLILAAQTPGSIVTNTLAASGTSAVDAAGNAYTVTYSSQGSSAPPVTPGAYQTQSGGGECVATAAVAHIGIGPTPSFACYDVWIGKSDPAGNLLFGTLLGGPQEDTPTGVAIDSSNNLYITGQTQGSFPTTPNAAIPSGTGSGVFAAKLSADGSHLLYSTMLPAAMFQSVGIGLDAQGNAYIAGYAQNSDVIVVKLSADGSSILYTASFGQTAAQRPAAIAVNAAGSVAITGYANSPNFPTTAGVIQPALPSAQSAFVTRLDPAGNIVYATFLGGGAVDAGTSIAIDSTGAVYVSGSTTSNALPVTAGTYQPAATVPMWSNGTLGFIVKLAPDGSAEAWGSYLPNVSKVALGTAGDVWLAGTAGAGFPVTDSAPAPCFGGTQTDFILHLDSNGVLLDASYGPPHSYIVLGLVPSGSRAVTLVADNVTTPPYGVGAHALLSQIAFGGAGWVAAPCISTDVVNQATFVSTGVIAAGELVTLTGLGIGPNTGVVYTPGPQGQVPTSLGGVQVFFNGIPAPLLYVQSRQVNAQVPFELNAASAAVTLEYNNTTFGPFSMTTALGMPGIFRLQPGVSTQAVAVNQDFSLNTAANPAAPGSIVSVYATGLGPTSPACATGGLNFPAATGMFYPDVEINTTSGGPAVNYEGSAPGLLCGIVQINLQIPAGAPPGPFALDPIFVVQSPVSATVAVK